MEILTIVVELLGLSIFVIAFAPQASRMWRKKHSFGMAPSSWTMNFIGRYLWVIASIFFGNAHHMATIMLAGQGLVAMLTIPMVYYSFRNAATKGEYFKHNFALKIFIARMIAIGVTFVTIIVCIMVTEGTIGDIHAAKDTLGIGVFFVQLVPAIFTGVAFLPQTLQTLRTKDTKSISLITTLMFSLGNSLIILSIILQVITKGISVDPILHSGWWYSIGSATLASVSVGLMLIVSVVKIANLRSGKEKLDTKVV